MLFFFLQKNSGTALIGKTGVRTSGEMGVFLLLIPKQEKTRAFLFAPYYAAEGELACRSPVSSPLDPELRAAPSAEHA